MFNVCCSWRCQRLPFSLMPLFLFLLLLEFFKNSSFVFFFFSFFPLFAQFLHHPQLNRSYPPPPAPTPPHSLLFVYESVSILFLSSFCSLDSTSGWNHMVLRYHLGLASLQLHCYTEVLVVWWYDVMVGNSL